MTVNDTLHSIQAELLDLIITERTMFLNSILTISMHTQLQISLDPPQRSKNLIYLQRRIP